MPGLGVDNAAACARFRAKGGAGGSGGGQNVERILIRQAGQGNGFGFVQQRGLFSRNALQDGVEKCVHEGPFFVEEFCAGAKKTLGQAQSPGLTCRKEAAV